MQEIDLFDAEAQLPAIVDRAVAGEPLAITRDGKAVAVILGFEEWQRLSRVPSFGQMLMSAPEGLADLPERDQSPLRDVDL